MTYYEILNLPENADVDEIKHAFRKSALKWHPDRNGNSEESQAMFIIISNAYNILTDSEKRNEYDTYLRNSTSFKNRKFSAVNVKKTVIMIPGDGSRTNEEIINYFNFLLWDIEDFSGKKGHLNDFSGEIRNLVLQRLIQILAFIEKWVLEPSGFPDYFLEARRLKRDDSADYVQNLNTASTDNKHKPFFSFNGYFYDIRKRMDKLIENSARMNLFMQIPGCTVRLIDCMIEAQNLAVHNLSYLLNLNENDMSSFPDYIYSNKCFM
ncbi:MAG: J domain-containing protein [Spirochaetes bacterium]|nr:J domain-containing protein [Spirochaetota bacterium]